MQTQEIERPPEAQTETPMIEVGRYPEPFYRKTQATFVIPKEPSRRSWRRSLFSPLAVLFFSFLLMVALVSYGIGASTTRAQSPAANTPVSSSSSMTTTSQAAPSNVPNATQKYGGQQATYIVDSDGAKHFTFTARQVMWEVVKGQRVLAWTINGTVPGPMIEVMVGDHVRVTLHNQLPAATAIHWHGLEVPSSQDGVPGLGGMQPIQPGHSYTYDFNVTNDDIGTHWYHSHYDDLEQAGGGLYGAFLVDPRPGTPQAAQAIKADVTYNEFIGMLGSYYVINGKSFPDTQPILVKHGQTVHLRLFGADTIMMHPMHLHGGFFNLVAEDGHLLPQPQQLDTVQVIPGGTYDLTFYAWAAP
ncbi:MAG TPA: multicopper oxidase domain-containing protein, partial [Ktedonobacteraceae bacterium]|nr:multicopper oxidase domain-containing protein [Ktedonobacteraceae bacterium]